MGKTSKRKAARKTSKSKSEPASENHAGSMTIPFGDTGGYTESQVQQASALLCNKVHPFFQTLHQVPGSSFLQADMWNHRHVRPSHATVRRLPAKFLGAMLGVLLTCNAVEKLIAAKVLTAQHARELCAVLVGSGKLPAVNLTFLANNKSEERSESVPKCDTDSFTLCGVGFCTDEGLKVFKKWHDAGRHEGAFEKELLQPLLHFFNAFTEQHPEIKVVPMGRRVPTAFATVVPNAETVNVIRREEEPEEHDPWGDQQLFHPDLDLESGEAEETEESLANPKLIGHSASGAPMHAAVVTPAAPRAQLDDDDDSDFELH